MPFRRSLIGLAVAVAAFLALGVGTAAPAAAFGGETLGCQVTPGYTGTYSQHCANDVPAATYDVGFRVFGTDSSYTFAWTLTGRYSSITGGCTSTSSFCNVSVAGGSLDKNIKATVVYTQGGQSGTRTSYAAILAYCNGLPC